MKNLIKKFISIVCITSLLITTSARADIDTQNMVGTTLVSAGALTTFMAIAGGAAAVIGTGGLALAALGVAILISNNSDTGATASAPISIRLNPNIPLITPSGWVDSTTPPSTSTVIHTYATAYATGNDATETCTEYADVATATSGNGTVFTFISVSGTNNRTCTLGRVQNGNPISNQVFNMTVTNSCPSGYTVNGSECQLTNAANAKKPVKGLQEVKRVGNTFEIDPQINPTDILPESIAKIESDKVTVNDSDGKQTVVKLNTDGTGEVSVKTPQGDGTTKKDIVQFSAPDPSTGNVTVIGKVTQTLQGEGTLESPVGGGSEIDVSSLNKEATQQGIKSDTAAINANTGNIKDNVQIITDEITNANNNDTTLTGKQTEFDAIAQAHSDAVADIGNSGLSSNGWSWSWSPTIPTGTCVPFSHTFMGNAITMDYCDGVYKARDLAGWLFYILTAMSIFSIATGRRE